MCGNHYESDKQLEEFYALNGRDFDMGDKDAMFRLAAHTGLDVAIKELAGEVDVNQRAGYALRYASLYGHNKVVKTLLEAGADVHAAQDCAIVWAAEFGHMDTVRTLLKHGAVKSGEAYQMAKENGHMEIARLLENV